jgi:hypothetical protein
MADPLIVSALIGAVPATIAAVASLQAKGRAGRAEDTSKATAKNLGNPNGYGSLVGQVEALQRGQAGLDERMGVVEGAVLRIESKIDSN